jgi:hypothetical protein
MRYVVEVHAPVLESPQTLVRKLVEGFNVRSEVANELMNLIPGTVTKPVSQQEATTISTMLSGIGLQVSTRQLEADVQNPAMTMSETTLSEPRGRSSIRSKFLASSILPALLTVAAALGAILFTVRPALRTQLLESARNPAIAFASVTERVIGSNSINSSAAIGELDAALEDTRASFQEQNISFVMITDASGNPLAGWYGNDSHRDSTSESPRHRTGLRGCQRHSNGELQPPEPRH